MMPPVDPARRRSNARERGTVTPAVLLHSTGSSGGQWKSLTVLLSSSHLVFTPDLPGYGAMAAQGCSNDLLADAAPTIALIERYGTSVHLVGHSYGGAVALAIAMSRPELVRSLGLIEPVAFYLLRGGDDRDRRLFHEIASIEARILESIAAGVPEPGMAQFIDFWNGEGSWARLEPAQQSHLCAQIGAVAANFAAIAHEPCRLAQIRAIGCPTLLIRGERSPEPVRRIIDILAASITGNARLAEIPKGGHMAPLTHPQLVDPLIADHMIAAERAAAERADAVTAASHRCSLPLPAGRQARPAEPAPR
jgi:pimeloyl-ACP methyl ester carboxylesterase